MVRLYALGLLAIAGWTSGCQASGCPLASQREMTEAQLFFGRDVAGRGPVTDGEWSDFVATTIARNFPDGFTVADGNGEWRDAKTGRVVREASKIVTIVDGRSAMPGALADVMATYRRRFHQQSVGVVTRPVCAAF